MKFQVTEIVDILKAAGEPTRLRLLVLCRTGERSVGELARAVGQSEPRVSRHLKLLSQAGLIERARRGQWVCYRLVSDGAPAKLVAEILARCDERDPALRRDRERTADLGPEARPIAAPSRQGRAIAAFADEIIAPGTVRRALVVDPLHWELVELAAARAARTTIVASRSRMREALKEQAATGGRDVRIVSKLDAAGERGSGFDLAILDLVAVESADGIGGSLAPLSRELAPNAALLICLPYDALEQARGNVVEHPIARLRRILGDAGFAVERLKPVEVDGQHLLAALARRTETSVSAA